jgi:predicted lysophospholipase L1 biosynthesis ABC-type transport system permease subunit
MSRAMGTIFLVLLFNLFGLFPLHATRFLEAPRFFRRLRPPLWVFWTTIVVALALTILTVIFRRHWLVSQRIRAQTLMECRCGEGAPAGGG